MGEVRRAGAVITGGGRGQGRSHAVTLARAGADIVICDIEHQYDTIAYRMNTEGDMEETTRLVEECGRRCIAIHADVRNSGAVNGVIDTAVRELGSVDMLCANAAVWSPAHLTDTSDELWHDTRSKRA